jgi:hypothetical protein
MSDVNKLAATRAKLSEVEAEVAAATEKFEASIAGLRMQCEMLRTEYMDALRSEMDWIERPQIPNLGRVLAAIEHTHQPVIVRRIRQRAVSYLVGAGREPRPEAGFAEGGEFTR